MADPAQQTKADEDRERVQAVKLSDRLGDREREIALGVARCLTNSQIAAACCTILPTVKAHVSHILTKLDLNNRVQIALVVYRAGLV
ncbi:response regulator transcription factor [Streptomyces violaceorubidus]|uniref:response regulator transcription factor n=1 Tax=Streptomyces violaceorubidus TaxID=284042 RepID=UPI00069003D8|nr:LuxR C-terminal-related transcriptional regulator [Streptomyces violaceorubidus]